MTKSPDVDRDTGTVSVAPHERPTAGFVVPDRFELLRPLGGGGQGAVWLAEDRALEQRVALKVTHAEGRSELRRRLLQEAQVGRDLAHPHLIRVFDLIEIPERLVVVMEWLPGGSLKTRLADGPLPIDEVLRVAEQVLEVLAYLHGQGVVHRDIKPSNLLLARDGQVKLADLGLVRQLDRNSDLTRTGLTVGTPDYMSPEQLQGEAPAPATDLYGLGVTLFELITGKRPFSGSSDLMVANQHLGTAPPSVRSLRPDCPRWLAAFVLRLLEKKPRDRWPDATAALAALRARRAPRWRLWRRRAAAAMLLGGVVGGGWALVDVRRPQVAEVVVDGEQLVALDAGGGELWRQVFAHQVTTTLVADVSSEPGTEVVVGLRDREGRLEGPLVAVLDAAGRELHRFTIDLSHIKAIYPRFSATYHVNHLVAGDLDGDGHPELIFGLSHPEWYPGAVGAWWGRRGGVQQLLLVNSGRLFRVLFGDAIGDARPELVVSGYNNPLGYQQIVMITGTEDGIAYSPDLLQYGGVTANPLVLPLGPHMEQEKISLVGGGGVRVSLADEEVTIAADGSVRGGDRVESATARRSFWNDTEVFCRDLVAQPGFADAGLADFNARHREMLAEPASRLAFELLVARSLARAGAREQAIEMLRSSTVRDPGMVDPWLRLGEQLLISGDRRRGREALLRCLVTRRAGRNPYDALVLLTLDAALHGDRAGLDEAARVWKAYNQRGGGEEFRALEPLEAFFAGRWSDPLLDAPAGHLGYYRPQRVIFPWAGLERGGDPAVVVTAARQLAANPEITDPARLLEASALLRLGRTAEARVLALGARESLRAWGRESFEAFIWVPVAEWVCGSVAEAMGRHEEAERHFAEVARLASGGVFGRRSAPRGAEPVGLARVQ